MAKDRKNFISKENPSSITLPVEGMSCGKCSAKINKALREIKGVSQCTVDHLQKSAVIEFDSNITHGDEFIRTIESLGYSVPVVQTALQEGENIDFATSLLRADEEKADIITCDPVCGMMVKKADYAVTSTYNGTTYYFCDPPCKAKFDANPESILRHEPLSLTHVEGELNRRSKV